MVTREAPEAFIRAHTALAAPPLLPEIPLYLATAVTPIWHATEAWFAARGVPPPFWAFAWAGGQALARYVLDTPEAVAGLRVLDFATGSGLVAIAAARAGASRVVAADIDPFAAVAATLNAEANGVAIELCTDDVIESSPAGFDLILAGDICYEKPAVMRFEPWLRARARDGARVLLGDPGRAYLPETGLREVAAYDVPTPVDLEGRAVCRVRVWEVLP
jgi:predicted nicotinamide N-methyase